MAILKTFRSLCGRCCPALADCSPGLLRDLSFKKNGDVKYGYHNKRDKSECNKKGQEITLNGRGLSKGFLPMPVTNSSSRVFSKFKSEQIWGVKTHRHDPSDENEERAQL